MGLGREKGAGLQIMIESWLFVDSLELNLEFHYLFLPLYLSQWDYQVAMSYVTAICCFLETTLWYELIPLKCHMKSISVFGLSAFCSICP